MKKSAAGGLVGETARDALSPQEAGDFIWAGAVYGLEAQLEAEKKSP
jgi:hypothetical protein